MDLCWLEQNERDVPSDDAWLSGGEQSRLATLHVPKRRRDWRVGRWTAKCLVAAYLNMPRESMVLAGVEVRAAPSGAPEVFLHGCRAPLSLSLSHSDGIGLSVIADAPAEVGCDLEKVEPRSPAFLTDYFTRSEQDLVAQTPAGDRDRLVTLLWSAKESALKLMRSGLREDPCGLQALPELLETGLGEWRRLSVMHARAGLLSGWWRESGNFVRTILMKS